MNFFRNVKLHKYSCIIFLSIILLIINILDLCVIMKHGSHINTASPLVEPGFEFKDLKSKLHNKKHVSFITNKNMAPEYNDGRFLQAQYILAPTVLNLNNPNSETFIIDATSIIAAYDLMQMLNAELIYMNKYSKIIAKKIKP